MKVLGNSGSVLTGYFRFIDANLAIWDAELNDFKDLSTGIAVSIIAIAFVLVVIVMVLDSLVIKQKN
jgi:hypothetical protein